MTDLPRGYEADGETVPWRTFLAEAEARLTEAGVAAPAAEARWLVEAASGFEGPDLLLGADEPATIRGVARFDALLGRRLAGEPLQYVLGAWAFRRLDLLVDRRVLIPRPETETVVERALAELDRLGPAPDGAPRVVADLGTGSGAIALSVAVERTGVEVWATDVSADALAAARANLAGIGRAATRVRMAEGVWFDALPGELRGRIDVVVSNPPYVAADEVLPPEVADWEPPGALVAGPRGTEALEAIVDEAPRWLAPHGVLVVELAPGHGATIVQRALEAGFADVEAGADLAGRQRYVVARRTSGAGA